MRAAALVLMLSLVVSPAWEHPLGERVRLDSPLVEVTPFVFKERLYRLENNQRFWDINGKPGDRFWEDEVRIRDVETDAIVSVPLAGRAFATAFVDKRVYVFAGDYGNKPWRQITEIVMTSSGDLINWTPPQVVLRANETDGFFFNTAVTKGPDGYVMLVETSDIRYKPFTFRYLKSADLVGWTPVKGAYYGTDKYVGGPALYFEGGWFYTLYVADIGRRWETRIARSRDLIQWHDARRPFIPLGPNDINASDAELTHFKGNTIVYYTGGNQIATGDLHSAAFSGTPRELFERFFH